MLKCDSSAIFEIFRILAMLFGLYFNKLKYYKFYSLKYFITYHCLIQIYTAISFSYMSVASCIHFTLPFSCRQTGGSNAKNGANEFARQRRKDKQWTLSANWKLNCWTPSESTNTISVKEWT